MIEPITKTSRAIGWDDAAPVAAKETRIEIDLRWRDLDFLGHLNQSVYHELLEEGRGALFEQLGALDGGFFFVLARVELDHRQEIRRDQAVTVTMRIESVGRSSVAVAPRSSAPTASSPLRAAPCSSPGTGTRAARARLTRASAPRSLEPFGRDLVGCPILASSGCKATPDLPILGECLPREPNSLPPRGRALCARPRRGSPTRGR